jgi:hypothetical protein
MYVCSNELFKLRTVLCVMNIYFILNGLDYSKNSLKNFIDIQHQHQIASFIHSLVFLKLV